MEDGRGRVELNFGNRDLLDSEFGCCLKKYFKLAKTGTYAILLVRYGGSDVGRMQKSFCKEQGVLYHKMVNSFLKCIALGDFAHTVRSSGSTYLLLL